MDGGEQAERTAAVERLRGVARADSRDGAERAQELEHALEFLGELDLRTLREIERELARPDSMITSPAVGAHGGLTAFLGTRYTAAFPASRYHPSTPVPQIRARLLDTLVFREIRTAHGITMFDRSVRGVQGVLGLSPRDSLAETGFPEYGAEAVFLLLDVAASFATVQLSKTSAHVTASMGHSGMDAYADALDACHFMTAAFAKHLLRSPPDPDKLVTMAARGRLDAFGISPTDLGGDRLRTELSKLRDRLPELSGPYSSWGPAGDAVRRQPPDTAGREDDARQSFSVSRRPGRPRTAGEAEQHHLSRKDWSWWVREHRAQLATVLTTAAIAIFWWSARAAALELSGGLIVLAGLMGVVAAAALAALLGSRAQTFFRAAEGHSRYTVLQGRRDAQFLDALRALRPDLFAGARHAGLPRLVTVVVERNGVLFLGRGTRPPVVAAFHWLHVPRITVPEDPPGTPRRRAHRVAFEVRRDGADVVLSLPLERAKVAWTQHSYLENKPLEAVLSLLQGLRHTWALPPLGARNHGDNEDTSERLRLLSGADELAGTRWEQEALDWEFASRPPLDFAGAPAARREQVVLAAVIVFMGLGCVLVPPVLSWVVN
ncbi:hypothetical protein [Kocuria rosea]|uniref:hypothetical protein n=1 Tax=Kocuria rosea TaxID=1275 RepID=UPI000D653921|nr:hypothetical protein [Kocuria rosea]PWF82239.1 hypothetical protein DEJ38_05885 [Kocuria rosea]THE19301.1 hypothetical protein E1J17_01540 [Kocuria rosea]